MKIIGIDIETSPNLAWVWGKYEQNVIEYVQEWSIVCVSWQWLGDDVVYTMTSEHKDYLDDFQLVRKIHELLDECDAVIAHNGDSFDLKKINSRFIFHGFQPPSPYKSIDTLKEIRKVAKFNSNKLDDIGETLGLGRKEHVDFSVWRGCMDGDEDSWKTMEKYNKQDVRLLMDVYERILPYLKQHPNWGAYHMGSVVCPRCGSHHLQSRGKRITNTAEYARFKCVDCGGWSSSRLSEPQKSFLKIN